MMVRAALTFRALPLVGVLAAGSPGKADAPKTPPMHRGPFVSIQGYGKQNPACLNWTDGCVLCAVDQGGRTQCSTPGIACQPHGLTCKVPRPPK